MARRRSIDIKGFQHKNPIPNASCVGNTLMSGLIVGRDSDGNQPDTLEGQCALVFSHMREIVEAGGGTTDDIVKVTVYLKDPANREAVNAEWTKMFPDAASRPARQTQPDMLDSPNLVTCDFTAIIDG